MPLKHSEQLDLLDLFGILSFLIGLENLQYNISQEDMDYQTREIDARAGEHVNRALEEIHAHLQKQDEKIDMILEVLNDNHKKDLQDD